MDMLVNLYTMKEASLPGGFRFVRVLPPDRGSVIAFAAEHFSQGWANECETALSFQPARCFAAVQGGELVGFACYDATARGFFGPIGVREDYRGRGIGAALLTCCLRAMREDGYGYAVIGWCDEHESFYREAAGAVPIPDSAPEKSVYGRLIRPPAGE